jgi:hypothetical protein
LLEATFGPKQGLTIDTGDGPHADVLPIWML